MSKNGLFGHFNLLFGPFFRGVQNGIFRTLKCTFGVSGFRGSVAGRGVYNPRRFLNSDFPQERKDGKNLNSQTWPGSPRRPSSRHPRPSKGSAVSQDHFSPQPPSLPILLPEPGSERTGLTKEVKLLEIAVGAMFAPTAGSP